MQAQRRNLSDLVVMHPLLDQGASILPAVAFGIWGVQLNISDEARIAYLGGLAAVSALVLTAAVFVCAMTYQATNTLMSRVRTSFHDSLLRNWTSIIVGTFLGAIIAVVGLLFVSQVPDVAMIAGAYALGLLITKFLRAVFWFHYVLTTENLADDNAPVVTFDDPAFLR